MFIQLKDPADVYGPVLPRRKVTIFSLLENFREGAKILVS